MGKPMVFRCVLLVAALCSCVRGDPLQFKSGGANVTVTAIAPSIFRVSVARNGPAAAIQNIYLDPSLKPEDVGHASASRVETPVGAVVVDPTGGTVSLVDAGGKTLIPPTGIADASAPQGLVLRIGWPGDAPFDVYGSGNARDSLVQHEVKPHVGNGIAVQPFFFSPRGFAAFIVGADADHPAQCDGQIHDGAVAWNTSSNAADLYLIVAPTLSEATRSYLHLTGPPPVPPRWSFGYLQCRWGWKDPAYIADVAHQFEARHLPVDAFIFDFEWYTTTPDYFVHKEGVSGFGDFSFNSKLFPHPAEDIKRLNDQGIQFVGIRKPRLANRDTLVMARQKGWIYASDSGFGARDLRFDLPAVRTWYAEQLQPLLKAGVAGWWDDEGEDTYTNYIDWDLAERQALDEFKPHQRLWALNRAFQPGTSRVGGAAWTGDIHADWKTLAQTPTTLLNWSLAGMPYCTCDIGGFNGETTPELLARWMEAGTFFPVMRCHSTVDVKPHFPWLFGGQAEAAIRGALQLRYRLLPTFYSLAHTLADGGDVLMRPLVLQYPDDPAVANCSDEWLFGPDLLAAPILTQSNHRSIYLPKEMWYDFFTGKRTQGPTRIEQDVAFDAVPVFVRAGAVLPLAPPLQHTRDLPGGPLDLQVYAGRDGHFTLAEDDGISLDYRSGAVRNTHFSWDDAHRTLSWTRDGSYSGPDCFTRIRVTLHGDSGQQISDEQALDASGKVQFTKP